MNDIKRITFNPKIIFKHKENFTNFKIMWQVIFWIFTIILNIIFYKIFPPKDKTYPMFALASIIMLPIFTWIMNKIFLQTIFIYNSYEITKIAYNRIPIICNLLFQIKTQNQQIKSISQAHSMNEDDNYYMYIQYKSDVNETISSYSTFGTGYNSDYNLSSSIPNKEYEYAPQRLNITIYKNNNKIYHNTLEHFEEIYHMRHKDPKIKDINRFVKISMNDALSHIIKQ
jgi:hypothetical protein